MDIGRPVSAILFGLGRGPLMIYSGQETGEPADGAEGFSGDDGRSSIFDYGSLPSLIPWVNQHKYDGAILSEAQKSLRAYYATLLQTCAGPAFTRGDFYGLNHANLDNPGYGRIHGESPSGHWLYSYMRRDKQSGQAYLIVANLNPHEGLQNVSIHIPDHAQEWLGARLSGKKQLSFKDALGSGKKMTALTSELGTEGVLIDHLPAMSACYFKIS